MANTQINRDDFPAPREGLVLTHFFVVRDQDISREWYRHVLGAEVLVERDPVCLKLANSWILINEGGGPTPDKPEVTLNPPDNPHRTTGFLNIRVANIQQAYEEWRARGAKFITEPIDRGPEIRCYMYDPDGHLIEVGQVSGFLDQLSDH